ncbi:MAG TPA: hypothetical protein VG873_16440, partial [Burkholderiales bacterium]|nr:hypothetical protein [Burkholderiales bacterium]
MSIRQDLSSDPRSDRLPDFRNLGVVARILVGANLLTIAATIAAAPSLAQVLESFIEAAMFIEPLLLACVVALYVAAPLLARLPYVAGCAAVAVLTLGLAAAGRA